MKMLKEKMQMQPFSDAGILHTKQQHPAEEAK
jgi:hypothetical protein